MIVRIVQMKFKDEFIDRFLKVFDESKENIRAFPGVLHLELLQNIEDPGLICTYSHWENQEALEQYRNSELFKSTWAKTKVLFEQKPVAWSSNRLENLD